MCKPKYLITVLKRLRTWAEAASAAEDRTAWRVRERERVCVQPNSLPGEWLNDDDDVLKRVTNGVLLCDWGYHLLSSC